MSDKTCPIAETCIHYDEGCYYIRCCVREKIEKLELRLTASRKAHETTKQAYEARGKALSEEQAMRMKLAKELSKYVGEVNSCPTHEENKAE